MANIPIYPDFYVQTMEDSEAFMTDTIAVRLSTRVPHEFWEEFKQRLGIKDELGLQRQGEITRG